MSERIYEVLSDGWADPSTPTWDEGMQYLCACQHDRSTGADLAQTLPMMEVLRSMAQKSLHARDIIGYLRLRRDECEECGTYDAGFTILDCLVSSPDFHSELNGEHILCQEILLSYTLAVTASKELPAILAPFGDGPYESDEYEYEEEI